MPAPPNFPFPCPAVADTLFTIRSDIALEWQADLQLIPAENAELFRHHKEMMVNLKDEVAQTQHPLVQSGDNDTAMRKANYDLLEKYCTHVATEQVERQFHSPWNLPDSKPMPLIFWRPTMREARVIQKL